MIIHQLRLENFGIYREQIFDLTPHPFADLNRPIILVRGQNGSGKTTFIEAIRLCLHGSLLLGSRVSRTDYEAYLAQHIHVPLKANGHPHKARIALSLDYVSAGQKKHYEIAREWQVVQGNVREYVHILEDGQEIDDLETREHKDSFLRELIPPGIADLFFFDGERLFALAENGTSSELLAGTIKSLLGLDLVEQLQKDLDIYLARQNDKQDQSHLQDQLYQLAQEISALECERSDLYAEQRTNEKAITRLHSVIAQQEQQIASAGSWFAERLNELQLKRERLTTEIDLQRRQVQELTSGLMPFAIAPQICLWVAERLRLEAEYERGKAAQQVLVDQIERISNELSKPEFWIDTGLDNRAVQEKILARLTATLRQTIQTPDISAQEIILRVSEQERQTLQGWIDLATTQTPHEFCRAIDHLEDLERELDQVKQGMSQIPADEALGPLAETLQNLNRQLGSLEKTAADLNDQMKSLNYRLEQMGYQRERVRRQLVEQGQNDQRIRLVGQTQLVLQAYIDKLQRAKLDALKKTLLARFNALCRKEDLVNEIEIDPVTWEMTLYRQKHRFKFKQLSAGERQLLAMAIMWALKEISNVPMPVIVDTPLGRLDSSHRSSVIQNYLPYAGHQVILLATDTEIDDQMLDWLSPAISRSYHLDYDTSLGATTVCETVLTDHPVLEEVAT